VVFGPEKGKTIVRGKKGLMNWTFRALEEDSMRGLQNCKKWLCVCEERKALCLKEADFDWGKIIRGIDFGGHRQAYSHQIKKGRVVHCYQGEENKIQPF